MPRRERRRYLALKVQSEQPLNGRTVMDAVEASVHRLFGEYGASQINLTLIKYNPERSHAIIRCSHKALEMVKASIASITEIDGTPAAIYIQRVSGTLKALLKGRLL